MGGWLSPTVSNFSQPSCDDSPVVINFSSKLVTTPFVSPQTNPGLKYRTRDRKGTDKAAGKRVDPNKIGAHHYVVVVGPPFTPAVPEGIPSLARCNACRHSLMRHAVCLQAHRNIR